MRSHRTAAQMLQLIMLVAFATQAYGGSSVSVSAAKEALRKQILQFKPGAADVLIQLPENQRRAWGFDEGKTINETIAAISEVSLTLLVEVRLVGFDGDGNAGVHFSEDDLDHHLHTLSGRLESVALGPRDPKALPVHPYVYFKVTKGGRSMLQRIDAVLQQADLMKRDRAAGEALAVPYQTVDDVIRSDQHRDPNAALTIYIINPGGLHKKQINHVYVYDEPNAEGGHEACPGPHWVGSSRHVWVDIASGPHMFGPSAGHKGQVFPHTLPHPQLFKHDAVSKAIVPDLAALVWSSCQHILWPPLAHPQLPLFPQLNIEIIHIHDSMGPPPDHLRQGEIQASLQEAFGHELQSIEVHELWLPLADCDVCVAAFTGAMKIRTGRIEPGSSVMQAHESRFLDSPALHTLLQQYGDGVMGYAGLHILSPPHGRTLPVYVFDLSDDKEPLLLDGLYSALPFDDMVIAVTSRVGHTASHFACQYSRTMLNTSDVTRDVLSAVLTSAWGVADSSAFYSHASGAGSNHLWSVGATPFGPLAAASRLSAPMVAAAVRNLAITQYNSSIARVVRVLKGFAQISRNGKWDSYATHEQKPRIMQRVNLVTYKVAQMAQALADFDMATALRYAGSLQYDALALEKLALKMNKLLEGSIACEGSVGLSSVWWAPVGAAAMWCVALLLRGRMGRNKMEKFY